MMTDDIGAQVLRDVTGEMLRTRAREFPSDPLRRAGIVNEEAGEAFKAAMDLTRPGVNASGVATFEKQLYWETVQTAASAMNHLRAMREDGYDVE